jgi:hypothetical protein
VSVYIGAKKRKNGGKYKQKLWEDKWVCPGL